MENTQLNDTRLSSHFKLGEFLNLGKYSDNIPTMQHVANLTYGCLMLLEPARQMVGPIIINSGFRFFVWLFICFLTDHSRHLVQRQALVTANS